MDNTKVKIAVLYGALVILSSSLAFFVNKLHDANKEVLSLTTEVKAMENNIKDLNSKNKELQILLSDKIHNQISNVQKEIKNVTDKMPVTKQIPLVSNNNSFKSWMDYRTITSTSSAQYKLIYSDEISVSEDGLLRDRYGYIGVAMGTYYTQAVGERFVVTYEDGKKSKFITLDIKADKHTINNANHAIDGSMVEFIIDTDKASESYHDAIVSGSFNSVEQFKGNIVGIEKVIDNYEYLTI